MPPRAVRGESRFGPDAVDADVDAPVRQAGTRDASDEAVLGGYSVTVEQLVESGFFRRVGFVDGGGDLDPDAQVARQGNPGTRAVEASGSAWRSCSDDVPESSET